MTARATLIVLVAVALVQLGCTWMTNTRRVSAQAYVRNVLVVYAVYATVVTCNPAWLALPIVFQVGLNAALYFTQTRLQSYITTEYLYSDYFEYFVRDYPCLLYYTEGAYGRVLGLDTLDTSARNVERVMAYGKSLYDARAPVRIAPNLTPSRAMKLGQRHKFDWIVRNVGIGAGDRVLEIGFGKLDLMRHLRDRTGASVVGINLSAEHVRHARQEGFQAYSISYDDLATPSAQKRLGVGSYDVVITNGSLEYAVNGGDSATTYLAIMRGIYRLLRRSGRWYTTTLHIDMRCFLQQNRAHNYIRAYSLLFGNEGNYPDSPNGLTRYARRVGFDVVTQENHWLDYFLYSVIWFACYRNMLRSLPLDRRARWHLRNLNLCIASPNFVESYMCYTPNTPFHCQPWLWQFIAQRRGRGYCVPTTHQWIIFRKGSGRTVAPNPGADYK